MIASPNSYANRIALGKFRIDNKEYKLATNNGVNHLHGGPTGFWSRVFREHKRQVNGRGGSVAVELAYRSSDGEEGYPGNLDVIARFELNNDNEFTMTFKAKTDAPTIVNLCNHGYWYVAHTCMIHPTLKMVIVWFVA